MLSTTKNGHPLPLETKNHQPEVKLTDKEYSTLVTLQTKLKLKISRLKTLKKTAKDLGPQHAINIAKKSRENLIKIRERLQKGHLLPLAEQKQLDSEKINPEDILTPKEKRLFTLLQSKPYELHHTSNTALLDQILERDKMLLDSVELERRGVCVRTATPDYCGIENNIFLGFGSRNSTIPIFVRARENKITDKREDYTTIQFEYSPLQTKGLLKGLWSSGHFFHYQTAASNDISPSLYFGETEYYWSYTLIQPFNADKKRPIKYLHFIRNNGTSIKMPLGIDEEIAADDDLIPFFAYSLLERLRFIGGKPREHLLENPHDQDLLDSLIEKLFPVYEFELHLPTKLPIDESYTRVFTPQKRKEMTQTVCKAAESGDIAKLSQLKNQGYPLDGYMYQDPYVDDNSPKTGLPLEAALKARQHQTVKWLLDNGANRDVFVNSNSIINTLQDIDYLGAEDTLNIFIAAFESGDLSLVDLLLEAGLDVNIMTKLIAKRLTELNSTFLKVHYKNKNSDSALMSAIKAVTKHKNFAILDRIVDLSFYCKNIEILQARLLMDIACVGDERIFHYFLKKFPQLNIKETNFNGVFGLFSFAMNHNNVQILPFLFNYLNKNQRNKESLTHWAIHCLGKGHLETAEWLIQKAELKPRDLDKKSVEVAYAHDVWISGLRDLINQPEKFAKTAAWLVKNTRFNIREKWELEDNCEKYTLLTLVMFKKAYDVAKYLIEEHKVQPCQSCVIIALNQGNTEFANYLISKNALIYRSSEQHVWRTEMQLCLIKAILRGDVKTVKWLVDNSVNYSDSQIFDALMKAGTPEIADLLSPIFTHFKDQTPVDLFRRAILGGNVTLLSWLAKRYTFNPQNHLSDFLCCCKYGFKNAAETMEWLLAHGLDPSAIDKDRITTIVDELLSHIGNARGHNPAAFLSVLTRSFKDAVKDRVREIGGKNLVQCIELSSIIHYGTDVTHIVEWMVDCGLDINKTVHSMYTSFEDLMVRDLSITPLGAACQKGAYILVKGLLEAGANPQVTYGGSRCAQNEAERYQGKYRDEVLNLLKSYGNQLNSLEVKEENQNTPTERIKPELKNTEYIMKAFGINNINYQASTDKIEYTPLTSALNNSPRQLVPVVSENFHPPKNKFNFSLRCCMK